MTVNSFKIEVMNNNFPVKTYFVKLFNPNDRLYEMF